MKNIARFTLGSMALCAFVLLAILALSQEADAIVNYTNNDDSGSAIWLEPPASLSEVHIWKRSDNVNDDWWKFNASAGQHIQVNFRKYERYNNWEPPFEGGTYLIGYEVLDESLDPVYQYLRTFGGGGNQAIYIRDSWGWLVPEGEGGIFYIRVFVNSDPNEWRPFAYYWLNLTVEDPRDLGLASYYEGEMSINGGYTADYDFEDYFVIDLVAGATSADLVTLQFHKDVTSDDIRLEVWETIPFGGVTQRDHMLNRTTSGDATDKTIRFLATHTGTFLVHVYRDFFDEGSTSYTLTVTKATRNHDKNQLPAEGVAITHAQKLRNIPIEMGMDTHDWYQVEVREGDTVFGVRVDLFDAHEDPRHGYELVIYNETGWVLWADTFSGAERIELPPTGTIIAIAQTETYYVRFSADPGATERVVAGFRTLYDIEFNIQNRPPVLVVPFEDTYGWDEDGGISIELNSHFLDPDGDRMQYFLLNRTAGFTYDNTGLSYWGYLNITSPPNWHGQVTWTLKAQDEGQTGDDHRIFVDLTFVVRSVPDLPTSNGTLVRTCTEDDSTTADLKKLFYDVDKGSGGVLTFGYVRGNVTGVEVVLDEMTGAVELNPGPDVFGTFTLEFFCHDDSGTPVKGWIELRIAGVNDIPRITAPIPTVEMAEGDDPVEMDLSLYFHDVDNEALKYSFAVPNAYSGDLNVYHKNNVDTESHIIIELLDDNFYGRVVINVTATDPQRTLVKQNLLILVHNVPNRPSLEYFPVGNPSEIEETQSLTFKVTDVLDPDEGDYGLHTFTWFLDDVWVADHNLSEYQYVSTYDDSGVHTVKVMVTDPAGLVALQEPVWTFNVRNKNRLPTLTLVEPPATAKEGQKVTLVAQASDPDGDDCTISWYLVRSSGDKLLGVGGTISAKLPAGTQTIDAVVEDGKGGTATKSHVIKVATTEEEGGIGMMLAIVLLVVIIAVVALALMMKRRGPTEVEPDTGMDLDSLQREYDPTPVSKRSSNDAYDPTPGDWEGYEELKP